MQIVPFLKWLLVIISATTWSSTDALLYDKKSLHKRNVNRQRNRSTMNRFYDYRRLMNQSSWALFAPEIPSPDEIDCYIEVEVTRTFGGKCVRLGGEFQTAVCQSGVHLDFWSDECRLILAMRDASGINNLTGSHNPAGNADSTESENAAENVNPTETDSG